MNKLYLFIILLLFAVTIKAQDQTANVMSSKNSTSTTLDSNAVFTGTVELLRGYNSISVTVRSDKSSATNGLKILFGKTSTITTANAVKTYSFSYTANDTLFTKTVGVDAPYFKVVYTTGNDSQTVFLLSTMLNRGDVLPRTSTAKLDVDVSGGSSGDLYVTQLGSSNSYAAWPSTTGTTIDSVSFSFTPKSITFINDGASTDTLFVSSSSSFPTANTIRRLGGEGFTKFWAVTKLYYKVGTTPAASKKIRVEAN